MAYLFLILLVIYSLLSIILAIALSRQPEINMTDLILVSMTWPVLLTCYLCGSLVIVVWSWWDQFFEQRR